MAGGKGTRLWPKSKGLCPKHILCFNSEFSLLQETFSRINGLIPRDNILVITTKEQAPLIRRQVPSLKRDNLIIEPRGKNTLPAILVGAVLISQRNPAAVMMVLPSDHLIKPVSKFLNLLKEAVKFVHKEDAIVTVGIKPDHPATGYGYIKIGHQGTRAPRHQRIYKVIRFVEKPPLKTASQFLRRKYFFWNSGIFIFRVSKILEESKKLTPAIYEKFAQLSGYNSAILGKIYAQLPSISIDTAILEKARDIFMVRANFLWCDLGSWESLETALKKDKNGNLNVGDNFLHKTNNSIVINEQKNHLVATAGLKDITIVHTPEATLIQRKSEAQALKDLVSRLEKDRRYRRYI
jgi:mannose-1-phosphate guanylyltransferase